MRDGPDGGGGGGADDDGEIVAGFDGGAGVGRAPLRRSALVFFATDRD